MPFSSGKSWRWRCGFGGSSERCESDEGAGEPAAKKCGPSRRSADAIRSVVVWCGEEMAGRVTARREEARTSAEWDRARDSWVGGCWPASSPLRRRDA